MPTETTKTVWTRGQIETMLQTSDRAVERAMKAIFERQTRDEQATSTTKHLNGIGFSGWTAKPGSYYAKWVLSGRHLTGKFLIKARRIAMHHAGQLTKIANGE